MRITKIELNDGRDFELETTPDFFDTKMVKEITQHSSQREGDKWYYDVWYDNGDMERFFEVKSVYFAKEQK